MANFKCKNNPYGEELHAAHQHVHGGVMSSSEDIIRLKRELQKLREAFLRSGSEEEKGQLARRMKHVKEALSYWGVGDAVL